jgi:hypothetical protein
VTQVALCVAKKAWGRDKNGFAGGVSVVRLGSGEVFTFDPRSWSVRAGGGAGEKVRHKFSSAKKQGGWKRARSNGPMTDDDDR